MIVIFFLHCAFQAVWVDDAFMGTALLSELAYHTQNVTYAQQAAEDVLRLQGKLLKNSNFFVLQHGYNERTGHYSCCKWARGKGNLKMIWQILVKVRL